MRYAALKRIRFNGTLFSKLWVTGIVLCSLVMLAALAVGKRSDRFTWLESVSETDLLLFGSGLLLVVTVVSVLAAFWIDRPLRKLMTFITEMGRGNFSLRIPDQRNTQMKRLAKLMNYMAEEMDHLQQINVSHIINEKHKTEMILRNIADGVLVTDPEERILVINATAEKWFGLDERDVLHKPIKDCIKNRNLLTMLNEVRDGKSRVSTEFRSRVRGHDAERLFEANAVQVFSRDNRNIGVVTVVRDITKERDADRVKTELVSMVAHELKSPLTSIYGFSELLLDSHLTPGQMREYVQVIQSESKRLTDFVNKFLDLSKLESGKMSVKTVPFDLKQVILQVAESFRGQLDRKGMRLIVEVPDTMPMAFGDQHLLEQVLVNLVSNAVKYSPSNSKVGVEVVAQNNTLQVNVIDNGYGIPKDALPQLFEKFYRVPDMENADEIEGSGLGLALVKEIVERHGGQIRVKSKLGVGSVFTFSLPQADLSAQREKS